MNVKNIRVGALVGMGPNSTSVFYDSVMKYARILYGAKFDIDFPEIIMLSLPTPFYPHQALDDDEMMGKLKYGIQLLDGAEVDFIVIPCNVVHKYYSFMQSLITAPILNIIDITVNSIIVKPHQSNVAIIATLPTVESNLYQDKILSCGMTYFHDDALQSKVTTLLTELKLFNLSQNAQSLWNGIVRYLEAKGCTHCIIACTDISICCNLKLTNIQFIDSSNALAKATIEKYLKFSI